MKNLRKTPINSTFQRRISLSMLCISVVVFVLVIILTIIYNSYNNPIETECYRDGYITGIVFTITAWSYIFHLINYIKWRRKERKEAERKARHMRHMRRRFKNGFRHGTTPKKRVKA